VLIGVQQRWPEYSRREHAKIFRRQRGDEITDETRGLGSWKKEAHPRMRGGPSADGLEQPDDGVKPEGKLSIAL
jgi:hypothetical protein